MTRSRFGHVAGFGSGAGSVVQSFLLGLLLVLTYSAQPAAYMQFSVDVNGKTVPLRWQNVPVRWYASGQAAADVTPAQFQSAVARAFDTWQRVPTSSIAFTFAGVTAAELLHVVRVAVVRAHADRVRLGPLYLDVFL